MCFMPGLYGEMHPWWFEDPKCPWYSVEMQYSGRGLPPSPGGGRTGHRVFLDTAF